MVSGLLATLPLLLLLLLLFCFDFFFLGKIEMFWTYVSSPKKKKSGATSTSKMYSSQ
jgi:hypothetical protein